MTVEEALAASVVDTVNDIFEIDPETRVITVPASEKLFGVANDGNSERKHFRCPKIVGDNIDLSTMHLYINYQNANGDKYPYLVEDIRTDGDYITFSWLIGPDVVAYKGQIKLIVCAKKGDGTIPEWNTTLAEGTVLEGLEATDEVVERNPDIITQLLNRMREVEKIATKEAMQEYVNTYLTEHPVEIDETLTNPYKGKTIVVFGDSILAGWGWKEGTGIIQPLKEKYTDAVWINKAESGANMAVTSSPAHTPIVNQITSYTGAANAIILDGGVNDKNNGISIGSIATVYDATYDISTFCGALESSLQCIMDRYPLAVKLYIIPHSFAKDNSYVDSIYSKAIEICDKWNMPYLDMRKCSQIAMTSKNKSKYTRNANSGVGDGVHPVESWYRTFYSPVIDQKLRNLGIGYTTAPVTPTVIAVTGVKLDQTTLTLNAGKSAQLTATVSPSNATNQSVKWSTSNSNVTVSNGEVTGKAVGTSVVTVTTNDGGYTAQCTVNVAENTVDPSESHTELESLSVDGNCYFDTEILPDQNTNTEAKLYVKSGTTYICGARDDKYKYGYSVTDNFYVVRGSVSSAVKNTAFWEDAWTIKQNGATATFGNNSVTLDNAGNFTLTSPYYIGCMSKNGEAAGAGLKGKIYYAKIYSGSNLVADMIPVKKSDGTLCLYDKVRKKYIYNAGTGTLKEG
ncbi:MAG: Ig-like domain-containing protein [Dorea sp.]|uniref:Ig-like domain-containing protein n=1 Tax=Dorea sp. TaxID=2040332 RepID=UPI002843170F|nr:Ig-like domain-containing protein [Dorea sp.]MDR3926113.1 Ig-like domain-containing protein [Dorea sp.]